LYIVSGKITSGGRLSFGFPQLAHKIITQTK
jgi:hypothetical protein